MELPGPYSYLSISPNDLRKEVLVGKGGYGEVWKGKWVGKGGGATVAIKTVRIEVTEKHKDDVITEVGIILKVSHVFMPFESLTLMRNSYQTPPSKYPSDLRSLLRERRVMVSYRIYGWREFISVGALCEFTSLECETTVCEAG